MNNYRSVPLVKQVCDALEREVNNAVRSQGLTYSQMQLLLRLSEVDGVTLPLKELEQRLNVSQSAVAGLAHRLEDKGFVALVDDTQDKRVKHARLTADGSAKCVEAHAHMDAIESKLTQGFSAGETTLLYELLRKAYENLA